MSEIQEAVVYSYFVPLTHVLLKWAGMTAILTR